MCIRPDPAARALATQAAGCPALGISERSGASALGFSLVRVISSHIVRCSPLRSVVLETFPLFIVRNNSGLR